MRRRQSTANPISMVRPAETGSGDAMAIPATTSGIERLPASPMNNRAGGRLKTRNARQAPASAIAVASVSAEPVANPSAPAASSGIMPMTVWLAASPSEPSMKLKRLMNHNIAMRIARPVGDNSNSPPPKDIRIAAATAASLPSRIQAAMPSRSSFQPIVARTAAPSMTGQSPACPVAIHCASQAASKPPMIANPPDVRTGR